MRIHKLLVQDPDMPERKQRPATPLMKCGHAANATCEDKPVCVICHGLDPGATVVDDAPPRLEGRVAKCSDCGHERPSNTELAFFAHHPDRATDSFYCGCRGWN